MRVDEIKDQESLEVWLHTRPGSDSAAIAHRAAMRVFPLWSIIMNRDWTRKAGLTSLPILRAILITGVARKYPNQDVFHAVHDAIFNCERLDGFAAAEMTISVVNADRSLVAAAFAAQSAANLSTANVSLADRAANDERSANSAGEGIGFVAAAARQAANADPAAITAYWEITGLDATSLEAGQDLSTVPLWPDDTPAWFTESDEKARAIWSRDPQTWAFWIKWWDATIVGTPLDWELQKAVALIPDEDWQKGATHIAALIAIIEERHRLLKQIADLKEQVRAAQSALTTAPASELQRSHNHPPELVDAPAVVRQQTTIIWAALEEAEAELNKPDPEASTLHRIGLSLLKASKAMVLYCASLGDVILKKASEELGSTGMKWALRAVAISLLAQTTQAESIGQALIELAKALATGG